MLSRLLALLLALSLPQVHAEDKTVRIFIFAGQSNMVGSDSKVADIQRFPPFRGLEKTQPDVRFVYKIGRENKRSSDGWTDLQPVNNTVGPELSFARAVKTKIKAPIAIIKVAAGGTHLGGDWNPEEPSGFKMYPLALKTIQDSLTALDAKNIPWRLEGFMWHQGENDMFNQEYMDNYGSNLRKYLARWRKDLKSPKLKFYLGELCTKTIWGMDLRPRMYAISQGQKSVTNSDPLAEYVPTSHVGVEIGGGVGLHYHYGTLGQLEHGVNYAEAYLRTIGQAPAPRPSLLKWPYPKDAPINLYVLAGHRNMEGERAFTQDLPTKSPLLKENHTIAYKFDVGGGFRTSNGWEPLAPAGPYNNFGPELTFGAELLKSDKQNIAIAKFTHSGSQIIDWTPEGSMAKDRHLYPRFLKFLRETTAELEAKGHRVNLTICYHLGENDMSFNPYRNKAAERLEAIVKQVRLDLKKPALPWIVSQQPPTDDERVNKIDVVAAVEKVATSDPHLMHLKAFSLPKQEKKLVLNTAAILELGKLIAKAAAQ